MSGKVVLTLASLPPPNSPNNDASIWGNNVHYMINSWKYNALESYDHHESKVLFVPLEINLVMVERGIIYLIFIATVRVRTILSKNLSTLVLN